MSSPTGDISTSQQHQQQEQQKRKQRPKAPFFFYKETARQQRRRKQGTSTRSIACDGMPVRMRQLVHLVEESANTTAGAVQIRLIGVARAEVSRNNSNNNSNHNSSNNNSHINVSSGLSTGLSLTERRASDGEVNGGIYHHRRSVGGGGGNDRQQQQQQQNTNTVLSHLRQYHQRWLARRVSRAMSAAIAARNDEMEARGESTGGSLLAGNADSCNGGERPFTTASSSPSASLGRNNNQSNNSGRDGTPPLERWNPSTPVRQAINQSQQSRDSIDGLLPERSSMQTPPQPGWPANAPAGPTTQPDGTSSTSIPVELTTGVTSLLRSGLHPQHQQRNRNSSQQMQLVSSVNSSANGANSSSVPGGGASAGDVRRQSATAAAAAVAGGKLRRAGSGGRRRGLSVATLSSSHLPPLEDKSALHPAVARQLRMCPALRLNPTQRYRAIHRLGKGTYGETWLVEAMPEAPRRCEAPVVTTVTSTSGGAALPDDEGATRGGGERGAATAASDATWSPGGGASGSAGIMDRNNNVQHLGQLASQATALGLAPMALTASVGDHERGGGGGGKHLHSHSAASSTDDSPNVGTHSLHRRGTDTRDDIIMISNSAGIVPPEQQHQQRQQQQQQQQQQQRVHVVDSDAAAVSNLASTAPIRFRSGYEISPANAFVAKIIDSNTSSFSQVANEVNILANIAHPGIPAFKEGYIEDGRMHIVMEFVDGGDLRHELDERRHGASSGAGGGGGGGNNHRHHHHHGGGGGGGGNSHSANRRYMPQPVIVTLLAQLCLAVEYLHRYNILHRDIKPENLIVSKKWLLKLADFGLAKSYAKDVGRVQEYSGFVGTPGYAAPEIWLEKGFTDKTDMFAIGCILFELIMLERAFPATGGAAASPTPAGPGDFYAAAAAAAVAAVGGGGGGGRRRFSERPPASLLRGQPGAVTRKDISTDLLSIMYELVSPNPDERPSALQVLQRACVTKAARNFVNNYTRSAVLGSVDGAWAVYLQQQLRDVRDAASGIAPGAERRGPASHASIEMARVGAAGGGAASAAGGGGDGVALDNNNKNNNTNNNHLLLQHQFSPSNVLQNAVRAQEQMQHGASGLPLNSRQLRLSHPRYTLHDRHVVSALVQQEARSRCAAGRRRLDALNYRNHRVLVLQDQEARRRQQQNHSRHHLSETQNNKQRNGEQQQTQHISNDNVRERAGTAVHDATGNGAASVVTAATTAVGAQGVFDYVDGVYTYQRN